MGANFSRCVCRFVTRVKQNKMNSVDNSGTCDMIVET